MANIKFSGFTEVTNISGIQEIVGYNGTQNVRITPANFVTSGGTGVFLPLAGGTMTGDIDLNDDVVVKFGTGDDLRIQHTSGVPGTSFIQNYAGDLSIQQRAADKDVIFQNDNGSGGLATYLTLDGGSTNIYFTNPGNLGIGTTGPTALFEVSKDNDTVYDATSDTGQESSTATILVSNDNQTADTFSQIVFHNKGSNRGSSRIVSIGVANASTDLAFVTENNNTKSEKMRITQEGNVLINHTPLVSETKLYVEGSEMPLTGDAASVEDLFTLYRYGSPSVWSGGASLALGRYSTGNGSNPKSRLDFKLKDLAGTNTALPETTVMTMQSNGDVGIGTTSPAVRLDFGSSTGKAFHLQTNGVDYYGFNMLNYDSGPFSTNIFAGNGGDIKLRTASGTSTQSTRLTVTSGGNVGIGTTNPDTKLHVSLNGGSAQLTLERTGGGAGKAVLAGAGEGLIIFDDAFGSKMYVGTAGTYNGNVGIGTITPVKKLDIVSTTSDVAGEMRLAGILASDDLPFGKINFANTAAANSQTDDILAYIAGEKVGSSNRGELTFATSNDASPTEKMRIDSAGNVGINFTNPTEKLVIGGSINSTAQSASFNTGTQRVFMDLITASKVARIGTVQGTETASGIEGEVSFIVNNAEKMRIEANGNLRITDVIDNLTNSLTLNGRNTGEIHFQAGTVDKMRMMSNGRFGVGTTSPDALFQVDTTDALNTAIFENSGQTYSFTAIKVAEALNNKACLTFVVGDALASTDVVGEISGLITSDGTGNALTGDMTFKTNPGDNITERMRITSAGGISFGSTGTAYGTSGQVLTSAGNATPVWATAAAGAGIDSTYTPVAAQSPRWTNATTIGGGSNSNIAAGLGTNSVITRGYTNEFLFPNYPDFSFSGWWKTGFPIGTMGSVDGMGSQDINKMIVWDITSSHTAVNLSGSSPSKYVNVIAIGDNFAQDVFTNSSTLHARDVFIGMGNQFLNATAGKNIQDAVWIGSDMFNGGGDVGSNSASSTVIIGAEAFENGIGGSIQNGVYIGREVGKDSGNSSADSKFNVHVGYRSMGNTVNGNNNVAVGYSSGQDASTSVAANYNSFFGALAGVEHVSGDFNTFIGHNSGPADNAASTGNNNTALGNGAQFTTANTTNEIVLGNSSIATLRCQVQTITALSDERDKSEIVDLDSGLDLINSLKPRKFVWDPREEVVYTREEKVTPAPTDTPTDLGSPLPRDTEEIIKIAHTVIPSTAGIKDVGFIAQELATVDDDFLRLVNSSNPEKLQASYGRLIPVLVKAIQELSAKVTALENA